MASPTIFVKRPNEQYSIAVEYSGKLPTGRSLSSGTVSATTSGGVVDNSVLGSTTATISGTQSRVVVQVGVADEVYQIVFLNTLDNGDKLEDVVFMVVDE